MKKNYFFDLLGFLALLLIIQFPAWSQAVQGVRSDIYSFSSLERAELADLIIQYTDVDVLQQHCDYVNVSNGSQQDIHSDFDFLPFHRVYLEHLEDWLVSQGHPEYVPLPYWDPSTPAPQEFRTAGPDDNGVDPDCANTNCGDTGPSCSENINWVPSNSFLYSPLPSILSLPIQSGNDICDLNFSPIVPGVIDNSGLSRVIEGDPNPYNSGWHNNLHGAMGGVMANYRSPAAAIFWIWHAYVDDVWKSWEGNCPQSTTQPVDLYIKDNYYTVLSERDRGEEPNIDNGSMCKSPDIWVRRQADGITNQTHQNPEYGQTNYIYVRVRNRGYQTSLGTEELKVYWAKASTALDWPNIWEGNQTIGNLQLGNPVGVQNIDPTAAQGQEIVEFAWNPPNPEDYNGFINQPHHFCLLARIEASNDPMFDELNGGIGYNTRANNNIAWKNISVIDQEANPEERGAIVFVGNVREYPVMVDFNFQLPKIVKGNPIFEEANVIVTLDEQTWEKWSANGNSGDNIEIFNEEEHQVLVLEDGASLKQLYFEPNELTQVHVGFDFIDEERSGQKNFELDLVQIDAERNEVMGGETYKIITKGKEGYYAPQDRIETSYDPDPYDTNGIEDKEENKVAYGIMSISPNPATTNLITVNYELSNEKNVKLLLLNQNGEVVNEYPVRINENNLNINLSEYPNGLYYMVMIADGKTINNKKLIIE